VNGFVLKGEDVVLDASESGVYVNGERQTDAELSYAWVCSGWLQPFCASTTSKLTLPWDDVYSLSSSGANLNEALDIQVTITWTTQDDSPTPNVYEINSLAIE
jgi:hypothetical protein